VLLTDYLGDAAADPKEFVDLLILIRVIKCAEQNFGFARKKIIYIFLYILKVHQVRFYRAEIPSGTRQLRVSSQGFLPGPAYEHTQRIQRIQGSLVPTVSWARGRDLMTPYRDKLHITALSQRWGGGRPIHLADDIYGRPAWKRRNSG
jgi:hypothetical protein